MMQSDDLVRILMTNTLGESILIETLRSAAYFVTRSANGFQPRHHITRSFLNESRHCYYFIQGTGLDILISNYGLEYDPDTIRDSFNYYLRHSA